MAILYGEDQPALHKILSEKGGGEERERNRERGLPLKFNPIIPFFAYTAGRNSSMSPTNTPTGMSPAASFPRVQVINYVKLTQRNTETHPDHCGTDKHREHETE